MISSTLIAPGSAQLKRRRFTRRSLLPLGRDYLWQIETGIVRTLTFSEDGTPITLGLWGPGDIAGRVLSKADHYQIECLTSVEATMLPADRWNQASEAMILHIQRFQDFLEILHCRSVDASLWRLLTWLANRFGREIDQGQLIELRLTHQEISELIGATRVTVTRLLKEFEQRGIIQRQPHHFIVLHEQQPFWHYEI